MKIYAHRGASRYYPENTLQAFEKALELGATAIELDVHNVEGTLVVFHDRRLDEISSGSGYIDQITLSELSQITVQGQPIPTLWQVLEYVGGRCEVNIELKGFNTVKPLIKLYPEAITQFGFRIDQLLISSFKHPELAEFKKSHPQAHIAPLIEGVPLDLAATASKLNAVAVNLSLNFINQEMIDDVHLKGMKVNVFTVNNKHDFEEMKALGVDGIFSDHLEF
ncbi:glycerophosphodiester phosphodiesterase [Parashewanella spongiae]|uniref:Glycerophosphodiester phosphodiesterase n=1 Tax=Parashewanella spongiae TaxID=342950 RepID=A0A3A6TAH6_9GAMM|nr:glycerophosphodiester phosphodiesterase [Parashewanella spongiae]MCL1078824.1 glycerophosphodiester phosphodiesterase [Parashewanella spongiae]RJY11897.1 glycerophosphodiester phosphodiesterase [Parashewanella spongiae]